MTMFAAGIGLLVLTAVLFWAVYPRGGHVTPFLDRRANLQVYVGLGLTIGLTGAILLMIFGAAQ